MDIPAIPEGERQASIYPVRIWEDHEPTDDGTFRPVDWIEYARKGTTDTTTDKAARLKKNEFLWSVLGRSYDAWKANQEEPTDGTPLSAWSGLTPGMAVAYKAVNLRTIEDIALMSDADLDRVGIMGARAIRDKAIAFVEVQQDTAKVQGIMADQTKTIERQGMEIKELVVRIEELAANQKKTPGRKPRQPVDFAGGPSEAA